MYRAHNLISLLSIRMFYINLDYVNAFYLSAKAGDALKPLPPDFSKFKVTDIFHRLVSAAIIFSYLLIKPKCLNMSFIINEASLI